MSNTPWTQTMPDLQFQRMQDIIGAPSPIGLEAAMTYGVIKPMFESFMPESWAIHQFRGNAGIVVDTQPDNKDALSVMIVGHADKIRLQVRSIGDDGKIWLNTDSFLPLTLIGNEVTLFAQESPGQWRTIEGGTVEALGAIHFADAPVRTGDRGLKSKQVYLDLQLTGSDRKKQVEALGIRTGNPVLLKKAVRRGFGQDSFFGAYLDNGLGCFVAEELGRMVATAGGFDNVRLLFAFAAHEEIGRFGSRVLVNELKPDVLIAVDVNHDYGSAPGIGDRRMPSLVMGKGFTLATGAITSEKLNQAIEIAARASDIPYQVDVNGRDTGTDAMAGVLSSTDTAATSIGFPIRNMHTITETGHTGDVLAAIHGVFETLQLFEREGYTADTFRNGHPVLSDAPAMHVQPPAAKDDAPTDPSKDDASA